MGPLARRARRVGWLGLTLLCAANGVRAATRTTCTRRAASIRRTACVALGEYTVRLGKPLGIVFEEAEVGAANGVRAATRTTCIRRAASIRRTACVALGEYTVRLGKPLGIVFEEAEVGKAMGVRVADLVAGGNADLNGRVCVGDELVSTSAVIFRDKGLGGGYTKFERQMVTVTKMPFDGIMSAIGSNDGRYGCVDVVLKLRPTEKTIARPVPAPGLAAKDEDVTWNALEGVKKGQSSMPIRPPRDAF